MGFGQIKISLDRNLNLKLLEGHNSIHDSRHFLLIILFFIKVISAVMITKYSIIIEVILN
jgi:hypothetical protein